MKSEGRLIDPDNIGRWPEITCHFKPKHCTPEELEKNVKRIYREFYGAGSMLTRLRFPTSRSDIASWMVNLGQRKTSHGETAVENFDSY